MKNPRFLTFASGELESLMRRIGKRPEGVADTLDAEPPTPATATTASRGKLLKEPVTVAYPDGTEGSCLYERCGPECHRFVYRYGDGARFHRHYLLQRLENSPDAIELVARESAKVAFTHAVWAECNDRFRRATEPSDGSRVKDESKYQMGAKTAKEQAGKYAVCQRLGAGPRLIPASCLFDTIEEANDAWTGIGNPSYEVACCNRLDRCWEVPKYNPMPGRGAGHVVG